VQTILNERSVASVTAFYDKYETTPASFKADTYGIQGGYVYALSETLNANVVLGFRRTQSTVASDALVCEGFIIAGICFGTVTQVTLVEKKTSSGYTFNAGLEKRWERDSVSGRISREISPSGVGSLVETDRVQVSWSRDFSPTLRARIDASAYRSRYVAGIVVNSSSRYYTIEPRLTWQLSQWWAVDAGYRYSRQQWESSNSVEATRNVVYVVLRYVWPKISVSR
jgi:hypothetical protein